MMRRIVLSVSVLSLVATAPAAAQFPFGIGTRAKKSETTEKSGCNLSEEKKRNSRMAGNLLGGIAGVRVAVFKGHKWLEHVVTATIVVFAVLLWVTE